MIELKPKFSEYRTSPEHEIPPVKLQVVVRKFSLDSAIVMNYSFNNTCYFKVYDWVTRRK